MASFNHGKVDVWCMKWPSSRSSHLMAYTNPFIILFLINQEVSLSKSSSFSYLIQGTFVSGNKALRTLCYDLRIQSLCTAHFHPLQGSVSGGPYALSPTLSISNLLPEAVFAEKLTVLYSSQMDCFREGLIHQRGRLSLGIFNIFRHSLSNIALMQAIFATFIFTCKREICLQKIPI